MHTLFVRWDPGVTFNGQARIPLAGTPPAEVVPSLHNDITSSLISHHTSVRRNTRMLLAGRLSAVLLLHGGKQ